MPRNANQQVDGDTRFMGIAPRLDPASLPEGMASEARNMRFRHGVAETRKGMYKCPWINNLTPEIDSKVRPFGEIHGVGVFRNPDNLEFVVIAADNTVYYTRQNNNPIELGLPTGVNITGTVNFTQAFNKIIMWRGEDFAPLVMSSEDTGFVDFVDQWDSAAAYAVEDEVAFGPLVAVDSITHADGVATVTTSAEHGYKTGSDVTVADSSDTEFNGRFNVTVSSTTVFTYEVASSTTPAGGTITVTNNQDYHRAGNPPATVLDGVLYAPATTALDGALFAPPDTTLDGELLLPSATVLDGAIDDDPTTTAITVDSTTGYPTAGTILIGAEEISYTATTATEFSGGARAQNGTTIASHIDNAAVAFVHAETITVAATTGYPTSGTFSLGAEEVTYTGTTATTFTGCGRGANSTTIVAQADAETLSYVYPTTITVDAITGYPATGSVLVGSEEMTFTGTTSTTLTGVVRGTNSTTKAGHTDNTALAFVHPATIAVASTTGYPSSGTIVVESEHISFTGKDSTNFTGCTRGADSTTIATHADSAAVTSVAVATAPGDSPVTQSTRWSAISTIMPNATHGIFIANRLTAPTKYDPSSTAYGNKRQFVTVSDALDHAHTYFNQVFRINFGSDSEIQDLVVYDENRLLIFTDRDVSMVTGYIVEGTNATFGSSVAIQPVVHNYGVSGRGAAVVVGSDCYFYASRRGIVSLAQTEQSKVRGVDVPLSEPIQPLIDRIDPRHEGKVRLAWWDNKLYCAVPLDDGADGNNALLVYDFINQSWASHDTGTAITPAEFFTATYNNSRRLFYIGADGFLNLIEENDAGDDLADLTQDDGLATTDFESYLLTRGYHTNDIDHREFKTAAVNISTWNPNFTIKAKTDGANESQTLVADRTKSRTVYYRPFDAAPYEEHNNNDDHANPYRQDYSVVLDVETDVLLTESSDVLMSEGSSQLLYEAAVGGFVIGSAGVNFNRFQETLEPFALTPRTGRYTQLELSNTSGRIKINQATLTNTQGDRTIGVKS